VREAFEGGEGPVAVLAIHQLPDLAARKSAATRPCLALRFPNSLLRIPTPLLQPTHQRAHARCVLRPIGGRLGRTQRAHARHAIRRAERR
jgi:hypothetical protein